MPLARLTGLHEPNTLYLLPCVYLKLRLALVSLFPSSHNDDGGVLTENGSLYGIALVPQLIIYLKVSPGQLVERNLRKNATLDYWESGRDLGISRDVFKSFMRYQRLIQKEFSMIQTEFGFHVVNGNRAIRSVSREICAQVEEVLNGEKK